MNNRRLIQLLEQYAIDSDALNEWEISDPFGFKKRAQAKKEEQEQAAKAAEHRTNAQKEFARLFEESKNYPIVVYCYYGQMHDHLMKTDDSPNEHGAGADGYLAPEPSQLYSYTDLVVKATEMGHLHLVKLDCDTPMGHTLTGWMGPRGLPAIILLKDGHMLDEHGQPMNALPIGSMDPMGWPYIKLAPGRSLSARTGGRETRSHPDHQDNDTHGDWEGIPTKPEQLLDIIKHRLHI